MLKEIIRFELKYRKGRAANYVYFGIIFLLCYFAVASPIVSIGGAVGQIKANSPFAITQMTLIMSFAMIMITSAVMGVAVLRDFEHNTEAILFSTPIKKFDYLMGRFIGSFFVTILIYCGIWLGFMIGFAVGTFMPWEVAWREKGILAFNAWHYFQPFLLFVCTNIFISGVIFFIGGALGRTSIVIYTQGILLLVLYSVAGTFIQDMEYKELAAVLDPFGFQAFAHVTQYWTPAEKNTLLVPLEGVVLYNRLVWIGIALAGLIACYYGFSFNVVRAGLIRRRGIVEKLSSIKPESITIPIANQVINIRTYLQQLSRMSVFYFKIVIREIPFIGIVVSGMLMLFLNAINLNEIYGTKSYPTTYSVIGLLGSFDFFFLVIAIFYAGELIWKERTVKINLIMDALPMPSFTGVLAKFFGLMLIYLVLLFVLIICGIIIQMAYGYFKFEIPVYFGTLYSSNLSFLALYTLLAIFIQVLVNNKFLGFALCILFFVVRLVLGELGLEHNLWRFASGSLGQFSDMNVYGHFVTPFSWFKLYWLALAMIMFSIAVVFSVRGSEAVMKMRWKTGKLRLTRPMLIFSFACLTLFVFSGFYIYYNTSVINTFATSDEREDLQERYERTLKKYETLAQPRIVETKLKVDIYPYERDFVAEGYHYLKNKTAQPIKDIHIQHFNDNQLIVNHLTFEREATIKESHSDFRYYVYELNNSLQPGDSIKMDFKVSFITNGFQQGGSNTDVVFNGTFFNNGYFPQLGYNEGYEIGDDDERRRRKLPARERMLARDHPRGHMMNLMGDDADHIRFEIEMSTSSDQVAIAPGYLQKEWQENDRRHFVYKMDAPMLNFYSMVSARYAVKRDKWNDVNLEIYYHPGHEYNLDKMMKGMKDALAYYSKNFSPYQYRQLRIMEFPRYETFAQSFANTVPFSEGIGFIAKVDDPDKDIDYVYYVTAHEVAHQWWAHQVVEANVQGNAMLSESMSQYSALMVMKHAIPPEMMEKYLKFELDRFLTGRASENKKEQPLALVETQPYIHYNKASLLFFALQDYIGEDSLNAAFRRYNEEWRFKEAPYPTTADLLKHIRQATPDSLKYVIEDMFETITLFENKAESSEYEELGKDDFLVTLKVSAEKIRADSTGAETNIPINDWIDIGVYGKSKAGKDSLLYLQKHNIVQKENEFKIKVKSKPRKAGIDPLHKLIDRHSDDNTKSTLKKEAKV
jgi:ABC-type transport system involved in multi-copper enzyme maturation permease subunit